MADSISAWEPQGTLPSLAALGARYLSAADQFARAPFGHANPPAAMLSDLLGVPALAKTLERYGYGQPLTNLGKANVPLLRPETAEAALTVAPLVGPAARATSRTANAVGDAAVRAITRNPAATTTRVIQEAVALSPLAAIVKPLGDINLVPLTRAEALKGPDVQPFENFLQQVQNTPGVTREGFDQLVKRYQGLEPGTKMSKTEFEQMVPASQYNKIDLAGTGVDMEHLRDEATNYLEAESVASRVIGRLGGSEFDDKLSNEILEYYYGNITDAEASPTLKQLLRKNKIENRNQFEDVFMEERAAELEDIAEGLRERFAEDYGANAAGYNFHDVQRLVNQPELSDSGYFEMGVTHPELKGQPYRHYGDYENVEEGLAGHFRGTYFSRVETEDARALLIGKNKTGMPFTFTAKPKSFVIEEIQSDAQKGVKQTGPLHQIHGTVFKTAVDEALQRGARTVYLPTAETISLVRGKPGSAYASIYDQQIVKEGLKPLLRIPGVSVTDIPGEGNLAGKTAYRQIDFTDEARDFVLNQGGQPTPGYAAGGAVHFDDGGLAQAIGQYAADPRELARRAWLAVKSGAGQVGANLREAVESPATFHRRALGNVAQQLEDPMSVLNFAAPGIAGVIKPKGGNWLAGQVEKTVAPLKQPATANTEILAPGVGLTQESLAKGDAVNKWLDQKLTKYIKNEMATPEDPLRLAADRWAQVTQPRLLAEKQAQIEKAQADLARAQRERGVPEDYLTRSRARVLELEKERDELTARTGLHIDLSRREFGAPQYRALQGYRTVFGYPAEATAASAQGKKWEDLADYYMQKNPAGDIVQQNYFLRDVDAKRVYAENPWLFKVPPETDVYSLNRGISEQDTGFKHMVDELKNAMNPESGLPKELQITAKDLDKMNVTQVAELVDRINAHRAVQKAEANKLAAQKSIEVYREYPDSPQGLRWVEMKQIEPKEPKLPEGYRMEHDPSMWQDGTVKKEGYRLYSPENKPLSYGETPAEAYKNYFGKKDLEAALKYEGDVMKHCVGGYCPDVAEGRSRIFSLRDSSGRPHVTVEVKRAEQNFQTFWDSLTDAQRAELQPVISQRTADMISQVEQRPEIAQYGMQAVENMAWKMGVESLPQFKQYMSQPRLYIEQIKGYKNDRPPEEMMPYINDFIKSGNWSSVGDLHHTNLLKFRDTYVSPSELEYKTEQGWRNLQDYARERFPDKPGSQRNFIQGATMALDDYVRIAAPEAKSHGGAVGMAAGGLVQYDPERVARLAASLWGGERAGYAAGGLVPEEPTTGAQGNWPSVTTLAATGGAVVFDSGKIQGLADRLREDMYG